LGVDQSGNGNGQPISSNENLPEEGYVKSGGEETAKGYKSSSDGFRVSCRPVARSMIRLSPPVTLGVVVLLGIT
jgi:hypothetical protein